MNYLAHWLIVKLEDWHQCSPEVWRVLMAGGALLVTALLLPLWRLPSNEQRHARVLSEWGNLQFRDSTAWFPKIWGIWGPEIFMNSEYKGGFSRWHHLLLQTHFGKTGKPKKANRATICCIASGDPPEDRAAFWTIQRRAVWKSGVTGDPKRRAQVIQVILDLFWIYSGFGTVECLGACECAICCMLPWTLVILVYLPAGLIFFSFLSSAWALASDFAVPQRPWILPDPPKIPTMSWGLILATSRTWGWTVSRVKLLHFLGKFMQIPILKEDSVAILAWKKSTFPAHVWLLKRLKHYRQLLSGKSLFLPACGSWWLLEHFPWGSAGSTSRGGISNDFRSSQFPEASRLSYQRSFDKIWRQWHALL